MLQPQSSNLQAGVGKGEEEGCAISFSILEFCGIGGVKMVSDPIGFALSPERIKHTMSAQSIDNSTAILWCQP